MTLLRVWSSPQILLAKTFQSRKRGPQQIMHCPLNFCAYFNRVKGFYFCILLNQFKNPLQKKNVGNAVTPGSLKVYGLPKFYKQDLVSGSCCRWMYIESNTSLSFVDFMVTVKFVLTSMFFIFNNKIYKQTFRAPMGSPLSPIIVNVVMQELEERVLNFIDCSPTFYYRYVDDIVLSITGTITCHTL